MDMSVCEHGYDIGTVYKDDSIGCAMCMDPLFVFVVFRFVFSYVQR